MHCKACDKLLSDRETTRKDEKTGEYLDLCDGCYEENGEFPITYIQEYLGVNKQNESDK